MDLSGMMLKGRDRREDDRRGSGTDAKCCMLRASGTEDEPNDRVLLMNAVWRPKKAFVCLKGPNIVLKYNR